MCVSRQPISLLISSSVVLDLDSFTAGIFCGSFLATNRLLTGEGFGIPLVGSGFSSWLLAEVLLELGCFDASETTELLTEDFREELSSLNLDIRGSSRG